MGTGATCFALVIVATTGACQGAEAPVWGSFSSAAYRYSIQYPASWYPFTGGGQRTPGNLDILNFPPSERVEGVVLSEGGAEITVMPAPHGGSGIEGWIEERTKGAGRIQRRPLTPGAGAGEGCSGAEEVIWDYEVGPNSYQTITDIFCQTRRGPFLVTLTNWKSDPDAEKYREFARRMAISLHVW